MVSGRVGMCVSCVSLGPTFTIAITCDEAICKDPERIISYINDEFAEEFKGLEDTKKEK